MIRGNRCGAASHECDRAWQPGVSRSTTDADLPVCNYHLVPAQRSIYRADGNGPDGPQATRKPCVDHGRYSAVEIQNR